MGNITLFWFKILTVMKKLSIRILVLIFGCFNFFDSNAQKNMFRTELGYVNYLSKYKSGHSLGFTYQRALSKKLNYRFGFGYSFAAGKGLLTDDDIGSKIKIRSSENPAPFPNNNPFLWSRASFPAIQFGLRPDRQFNMNICNSVNYALYEHGKGRLLGGLGFSMSYVDNMSLDEIIVADYKDLTFAIDEKAAFFPVFKYEIFIDIGLIPYVEYLYQMNDKIFIGVNTQFNIAPLSDSYYNTTSLVFGFKF
jgi:hypothetical protein